MAWPTVVVDTTHLDSATDSPGNARADIKQMADNVNAIKDSRNAANGIAPLDASGLLPTGNLPTVPANKGGTGQAGFVVGDILVANSTTTLSKLSPGANGMVLTSNGAGAAPSYQAPSSAVADATTTVKGIVELATNAETVTGTDTVRAVTPSGVKAAIDALDIGGMTLLGTLTTTSGTTQTLGSLNLTNYKYLYIDINGVSFTAGNKTMTLGGVACASETAGPTGAANTQKGIVLVDLDSGLVQWSAAGVAISTPGCGASDSSYNNASTSIQFAGGTFDAGTIKVYGVK